MITINTVLCETCSQYRINLMVIGELVGHCLCLLYQNEKAKVMYINNVFVKEEKRGNGYGKEIMRDAVEFARMQGVDSVELTVNKDNEIARRIYQSLGFEERDEKIFCRRILNAF